jgi:hypothetical protein
MPLAAVLLLLELCMLCIRQERAPVHHVGMQQQAMLLNQPLLLWIRAGCTGINCCKWRLQIM